MTKCPNCNCELELQCKDGTMPEEVSLVKSQHAEIGKSIDKDDIEGFVKSREKPEDYRRSF